MHTLILPLLKMDPLIKFTLHKTGGLYLKLVAKAPATPNGTKKLYELFVRFYYVIPNNNNKAKRMQKTKEVPRTAQKRSLLLRQCEFDNTSPIYGRDS